MFIAVFTRSYAYSYLSRIIKLRAHQCYFFTIHFTYHYLRLSLARNLFLCSVSYRNVLSILRLPMRAICPAYLIIFD